MIYDIRHCTTFEYEEVVSLSQHVLHLAPRDHARQRCLATQIAIEPAPSLDTAGKDYFGNFVQFVTVEQPHQRLSVESRSRVEVTSDQAPLELGGSPSWNAIAALMDGQGSGGLDAAQFAFESPYVSTSREIHGYAAQSFTPNRPILECVMELTARIFRDFEYRGGVSDVSTPVSDVLAMRQGVCQDFAHFQIACLRSLGLPARYVSGYLLTHPAPGQPKLTGADASHAWLSVWAGERGWVDFDPTNNVLPRLEHITVGWGRDYGDVSPINGFIVGGGAHQIAVAVDVTPAAAA